MFAKKIYTKTSNNLGPEAENTDYVQLQKNMHSMAESFYFTTADGSRYFSTKDVDFMLAVSKVIKSSNKPYEMYAFLSPITGKAYDLNNPEVNKRIRDFQSSNLKQTFLKGNFKKLTAIIDSEMSDWINVSERDTSIDIQHYMKILSMKIWVFFLFGDQGTAENHIKLSNAFQNAIAASLLAHRSRDSIKREQQSEICKTAVKSIDDAITELFAKTNAKQEKDRPEIFGKLEELCESLGELKEEKKRAMPREKNKQTQAVNAQEICKLILMAGYHTIASTASFALYAMATNKGVAEELSQVVNQADVSCKGLSILSFKRSGVTNSLYCFLFETMRLYPASPYQARVASKNCTVIVKDKEYKIEKGTKIFYPNLVLNRLLVRGKHADQFNPEIFKEGKARKQLAQLTYGTCPGQGVATPLLILILWMFLKKMNVPSLAPGFQLIEKDNFVLEAEKGIKLVLEASTRQSSNIASGAPSRPKRQTVLSKSAPVAPGPGWQVFDFFNSAFKWLSGFEYHSDDCSSSSVPVPPPSRYPRTISAPENRHSAEQEAKPATLVAKAQFLCKRNVPDKYNDEAQEVGQCERQYSGKSIKH